jgi:ATP-binding cassette subfamily F protein uup
MAVVCFRGVSFGYVSPPLLDHVDFSIERGERIGLLGRNGAGKSTLMRLVSGDLKPDVGIVDRQAGARIARLEQEVPVGRTGTIFDEVAMGLGDVGPAIAAFYKLHQSTEVLSDAEQADLQRRSESLNPETSWKLEHRVDQVLDKMQLNPTQLFDSLSSGMKRRVLLAKALVLNPDVLLLDEPTNHLDIDAIAWLEEFLLKFSGTLIFITHDRVFLQKVATRIVELDRGKLYDWTCDYATFLVRKQDALLAEEQQQALFDKKLAQEEAWIRRGVKARCVRNEGRVRALKKLREERMARRERVGSVQVEMQDAERSGALVIDARNVSYQYNADGPKIVQGLSTTIMRGDKVGIIGPNGAGKTTLLRLLLGELEPTSGTIRLGTNREVAYFDQLRAQLDENQTVQENVASGQTELLINGRKRHIIGYMEDFLFTPERSRSLVRYLSGGERNRLLLARLFSKPSNVLVLDEPTNDLDAETLELLEDLLVEYPGTVMLVSHDRAFLNEVVTNTLVFEGEGVVKDFVGGYDDWLSQRQQAASAAYSAAKSLKSESAAKPAVSARPTRLSFKEQKELEQLPRQIERLETEQAELHEAMAQPGFYQKDKLIISEATQRIQLLQHELTAAYERWQILESRSE